MNRQGAAWRDPDPRRAIGQKIWDAPTLKAYPQHIRADKRGGRGGGQGRAVHDRK